MLHFSVLISLRLVYQKSKLEKVKYIMESLLLLSSIRRVRECIHSLFIAASKNSSIQDLEVRTFLFSLLSASEPVECFRMLIDITIELRCMVLRFELY